MKFAKGSRVKFETGMLGKGIGIIHKVHWDGTYSVKEILSARYFRMSEEYLEPAEVADTKLAREIYPNGFKTANGGWATHD